MTHSPKFKPPPFYLFLKLWFKLIVNIEKKRKKERKEFFIGLFLLSKKKKQSIKMRGRKKAEKRVGASHTNGGQGVCGGTWGMWGVCTDYRFFFFFLIIITAVATVLLIFLFFYHEKSFEKEAKKNVNNQEILRLKI